MNMVLVLAALTWLSLCAQPARGVPCVNSSVLPCTFGGCEFSLGAGGQLSRAGRP
jgi:hypothetical protein